MKRSLWFLSGLALALSLVALIPGRSVRYVWDATPNSGWGCDGIWIGDGGMGYISYVPISEYGKVATWDVPLGWSLGKPLDRFGAWPEWGTDFFGTDYCEVPIWMLSVLLTLPFATVGYRWWRRRHRMLAGHCATCGYNLTGNVTGRCPECGTMTTHDVRPFAP